MGDYLDLENFGKRTTPTFQAIYKVFCLSETFSCLTVDFDGLDDVVAVHAAVRVAVEVVLVVRCCLLGSYSITLPPPQHFQRMAVE